MKTILVSTGQTIFKKQLKIFLTSLKNFKCKENSKCKEICNISILSPNYSFIKNKQYASNQFFFDIGNEREDKFYAKFVICEFVKSVAFPNENILYLDVDHICRKNFSMPSASSSEIFVSSEVKPISELLKLEYVNLLKSYFPFLENTQSFFHYNTSIIYGKSGLLASICDDWKQIYEILYKIIPHNILEEISFSIALLKNKITISPISTKIQSSFYNLDKSCSLFHYGGPFKDSILIKNCILSNTIDINSYCINIEDFIRFSK